jgi:hypothetical protein
MEVVDGENKESNGFRGVWIVNDEGMVKKQDYLGKRVSLGGMGNKLVG